VPEETVFGLRPAERNEAVRLQPQLRMYGEDLLQDTMGIGTRLARAGRIEESLTHDLPHDDVMMTSSKRT